MNRLGGKSNTGEGGEDPARYVPDAERRLAQQRDQAGRLGPLRRDQPLPGQRQGAADQDGAGRQARRGRPAPGQEGLSLDRQGPPLDAGRRPDLAAAAPRHLLDRGPGGADPRPQERQRARAHQRQAGGRGRRRHDRRRRRQGARRRGADQRPRRRHRRLAAHQHQARRASRGSWAWPRPTRCCCSTTCAAGSPSRPTASSRPAATWSSATLLGAEEFGFATAPLVALGCVMMRVCHLNTCPVGVATQDPRLRARFTGSPEHVVNFMRFVAQEVRELMAALGFRRLDEMVGRSDCLETKQAIEHWKARGLDFSPILHRPEVGPEVGRYCSEAQDHGLDESLDKTMLLQLCKPALEKRESVAATLPIRNVQPRRGHDPRQRGDAPLRRRRAARRHDPAHLPGLGRPELRRLHPARHHADARGRRQRLRRQGALGRAHHRLSAARLDLRPRAEHDRRQRRPLRRDRRRGVLLRRGRRALRGPQQRRQRRGRGRRRPRLRVHDRRARRRARRRRDATSPPA